LLCQKIAALGIDIAGSPYQETDQDKIVDVIVAAHNKVHKIIIGGDSLGANNTPAVAAAARQIMGVDYIFGFQPSLYGVHNQITPNVIQARCIYNPDWLETGGGTFVVTASAAGLLTMLQQAPYSVSKHAAVAFAEWLSATYGDRGITVHAICPQGVDTAMVPADGPVRELLTFDGLASPDEVAHVLLERLADGEFYVLPHPRVRQYAIERATEPDRWLHGMRRLRHRLEGDT
jgi:NAD(P)-dependent dehydrogenase (short-subunit alcohol dehydrogenase family)